MKQSAFIRGRISRAAIATTAAFLPAVAHADEPLFGFVYTTDTLPKGKKEVEQWVTVRQGRSQGDFRLLQTRTEFSYGASDSLQLSGYLNFAYADVYHNAPSGETSPPEVFADFAVDPNKRFRKLRFETASAEAIWRIASPYSGPVGVALYVEPSVGPRTRELENKLIVQKNFHDDRIVLAANATLSYEWRKLPGDPAATPGAADAVAHWDKETDVNFGVAGSYRFTSNWSLGAELQNEHEWAGLDPFDGSKRINQAWYTGPSLHYGGRHFFATLTALAQLPWAHDYEHEGADSFVVDGITNADDFENVRVRLKLGYYF
jgi:hypothetical protein